MAKKQKLQIIPELASIIGEIVESLSSGFEISTESAQESLAHELRRSKDLTLLCCGAVARKKPHTKTNLKD